MAASLDAKAGGSFAAASIVYALKDAIALSALCCIRLVGQHCLCSDNLIRSKVTQE